MIMLTPHLWWDHATYAYDNPEILRLILETKRERNPGDVAVIVSYPQPITNVLEIDEK